MLPGCAASGHEFQLLQDHHDSPLGRWTLTRAMPRGPLALQVEMVWLVEGQQAYTREEILPRTSTEVLFSLGQAHRLRAGDNPDHDRVFDRAWISGLQRHPLAVESPARSRIAGVRLRAAGVAAFLRDSPRQIAESVVDLDAIFGRDVELLREQMCATPNARRCLLILAGAVARHQLPAPPLAPEVRWALDAIHASLGAIPIAAVVAASQRSHRYLAARFRDEVGTTPKAYARLVRFEHVVSRLQGRRHVDWAHLALDCGYYDQAHLALEFRELAGATPAQVLRRQTPDGLALLEDDSPQM